MIFDDIQKSINVKEQVVLTLLDLSSVFDIKYIVATKSLDNT